MLRTIVCVCVSVCVTRTITLTVYKVIRRHLINDRKLYYSAGLGKDNTGVRLLPKFLLWNFNSGHVGGMSAIADVVSSWLNIHISGVKAIWAEDVFSNEHKYDTKINVPFFFFYCSMLIC